MIEKFDKSAKGLSDHAIIDKLNELIDAVNSLIKDPEVVLCPHCGSSKIFFGPSTSTLIYGRPNIITQNCTCNVCGTKFINEKRG